MLKRYEFVWLLSGSVRWTWHGADTEQTIQPGELLLIRPGMRDSFSWDGHRPSRHGYAHFDLAPRPSVEGVPLLRTTESPAPLAGLLSYLLWLGEAQPPMWRERATDVISLTVRTFIDGPLPEPDSTTEPPAITAALDYVCHEWRDEMRPVSLTELAAAAGTSNSQLARMFRQHFGLGAVTILELVRLARAETLLTRSNLAINQIARACGFVDPLHFSRRFRATYQLSPRAYRQASERDTSPLAVAGLLPIVRRLVSPDLTRS